jgi:hypothetical protein
MYTDLSNVAHNIFSIIPHRVGVKASFCSDRDVIGWRRSKTICETLHEVVVVRLSTRPNSGILASIDAQMDSTSTEQDSKM